LISEIFIKIFGIENITKKTILCVRREKMGMVNIKSKYFYAVDIQF